MATIIAQSMNSAVPIDQVGNMAKSSGKDAALAILEATLAAQTAKKVNSQELDSNSKVADPHDVGQNQSADQEASLPPRGGK